VCRRLQARGRDHLAIGLAGLVQFIQIQPDIRQPQPPRYRLLTGKSGQRRPVEGEVELRARVGAAESNATSVRIELQAVCYAGVWARHVEERFGTIEPGDLEEAVHAAHPIGDDTLSHRTGRVPMPHTFTHGTSAQRARWIMKGYQAGDMRVCDRFCTDDL